MINNTLHNATIFCIIITRMTVLYRNVLKQSSHKIFKLICFVSSLSNFAMIIF